MSDEMTRGAALKRFGAGVAGLALGGELLGAGRALGATASRRVAVGKSPIKIGALTDLTGPYGIVGKANIPVARMAINEINAAGGILGRRVELIVADGASTTAQNAKVATQLVTSNRVDMVIGGVTSAERFAVKDLIAKRGRTLYIWPASYEGGECDPNVWSVGAVPNQQVNPTVSYLLAKGAKTFYLCGNDYSYPRNVLKAARAHIEAGGGRVVGEDYIPITATDAPELVSKTLSLNPDALFEVVILPATVPFIKGVVDGGYKGMIAGTLFDQTINPLLGKYAQGLICAQDYYPSISDTFSIAEAAKYQKHYPTAPFGSALNSPAWYRGIYLWKAAVEKAGSTKLNDANKAMSTASYKKLIGGPARFVAGTRHCQLTMYLGEMQADGSVKTLKNLGSQLPVGQCTK
jgi:ABC-type branched-subunit amino acid transport system substrate-binding protein